MAKKNGTNANDVLRGTATADTIFGFDGNDQLFGAGGDDLLAGGLGADKIYGDAGNDSLHGDKGADRLDGGTGVDWALYLDGAVAGIQVFLYQHRATGGAAQGDTLFNIENVQGTNFADTIHGDANNNWLLGGAGADHLFGREGDDFLTGGDGADRLDGGTGTDWSFYKDGAKKGVIVSLFNNANGLGAAGDVLVNIENVQGTDVADTISGSAGSNVLRGEKGNDKLYGREGEDILNGGLGADRLDGGTGSDWADYAEDAGININLLTHVAAGGASGDVLISIENIIGTKFADRITGDGGANVLDGGAGNDTILGGAGNDNIVGGLGADVLDGGDDNDWLIYFSATAGVTVNLKTNATGGAASGDVISNFENVQGSAFGDTLTGTDTQNYIDASAGDDLIFGLGGDDTLDGGKGADTIDGGDGRDIVVYRFVDKLFLPSNALGIILDLSNSANNGGYAAGDVISNVENVEGTKYADDITGDAAGNVLLGGSGNDTIHGGAGSDGLYGGAGNDLLVDDETANAADFDVFLPGLGSDTVMGDGNDTVEYSDSGIGVTVDLSVTGADQTNGGADGDVLTGILSITGSDFDDHLTSSVTGHGTDIAVLRGRDGNDTIVLNHDNDRAFGDGGADTIILKATGQRAEGGAGNDTLDASAATSASLFGGLGSDTLTGNLVKTDFFVLEYFAGNAAAGSDTITNFVSGGVNGDKLAIENTAYGFAAGRVNSGLQVGEFTTQDGGTITGTGSILQFIFDTVGKGVWVDDDGAGAHAAVLLATLDASVTTLSGNDFLIF